MMCAFFWRSPDDGASGVFSWYTLVLSGASIIRGTVPFHGGFPKWRAISSSWYLVPSRCSVSWFFQTSSEIHAFFREPFSLSRTFMMNGVFLKVHARMDGLSCRLRDVLMTLPCYFPWAFHRSMCSGCLHGGVSSFSCVVFALAG